MAHLDHRKALKGRMAEIISDVSEREGDAIIEHLLGGTSAAWLSKTLTEHGHPVGKTAVKDQRARLRKDA